MIPPVTRRGFLSRSLHFAARATIAPILASCGRSRARQPRDKSVVTVLYPGDGAEDLALAGDMPAKFLVFMPLALWNSRGELEGRLAERWEHSPDYRTWTIRLRDGIKWHDSVPVTAHDMKFTLDLLQHPDTLWYAPGSYTVNLLDNRTYVITYQHLEPESALDGYVACWPKHLLERLDPKQINTWDFWSQPVGCGPYRHVRTVPHTMMEFEANPDYFRGRPKIERVVLKFTGWNYGSSMPELLSGNVDATACWYRKDVASASRDRRFRVYQHLGGGGNYAAFWWNVRHPLFQDAAVRRALTLAINRHELIQLSDLPAETPVVDFAFTQRQLQRGDLPEPLPYDPELASQLLDRAGWFRRNGGGSRERGGKTFGFTVLVAGDWDEGNERAVYVQDQLKRVGIRMDISGYPSGDAIWERVKAGEFEAADIFFYLDNRLKGRLQGAGYDNPTFLQRIEKALSAFDPAERDQLWGELTAIFQAGPPVTLLFPDVVFTIASTRIRGLENSPYRGDLTRCMDELWLEEGA